MASETYAPLEMECQSVEWYTPLPVLDKTRQLFRREVGQSQIILDPCAPPENHTRARYFFTEKDDGLKQEWSPYRTVFMNPPYGKEIKFWWEKALESASVGQVQVHLCPVNRSEQAYFHNFVLHPRLTSICFVRKRLKFLRRVDRYIDPTSLEALSFIRLGDSDVFLEPHDSNRWPSWLFFYNCTPAHVEKTFSALGKVVHTTCLSTSLVL